MAPHWKPQPVLPRALCAPRSGSGSGSGRVSWNARSSSSSVFSPGRSGRSSACGTSEPTVRPRDAPGRAAASADMRSSCAISSRSSPAPSLWLRSSSSSSSLTRSIVVRIRLTASPVTGMPSRKLPISASAACVSASSRGSPRKPQVPLMVWTSRKMLSRILALFGSCSKRTNSTSTTSRLSLVSVRNSRSNSSMNQDFRRNTRSTGSVPAREPIRHAHRQCVGKLFNFGCAAALARRR